MHENYRTVLTKSLARHAYCSGRFAQPHGLQPIHQVHMGSRFRPFSRNRILRGESLGWLCGSHACSQRNRTTLRLGPGYCRNLGARADNICTARACLQPIDVRTGFTAPLEFGVANQADADESELDGNDVFDQRGGNGGTGNTGGTGGGGNHNGNNEGPEDPGNKGSHIGVLVALVMCCVVAASNVTIHPSIAAHREFLDGKPPLEVSIIVPVLNEASTISSTMRTLNQLVPTVKEIIVVDGGSTDSTVKQARSMGARVIQAGPEARGRSKQMNAGADLSTGDVLCFVHADTRVPLGLVSSIRRSLGCESVVGGGFVPIIASNDCTYWVMSMHNLLKSFYLPLVFKPPEFFTGLRILFGDQVMFCRRSDFFAVNGFDPKLAIMEDADLCIRLHELTDSRGKKRRIKVVNRVVETSGRRFDKYGTWYATYIHFRIGLTWYLTKDNNKVKDLYDRLYSDVR